MRLLGASVRPVESGSRTLKDAINEAMRDWVGSVRDTYYLIGSTMGPHPYPMMVRDFQAVDRTRGSQQCGLLELPPTTMPPMGRNLPAAGGGWFRLLPYELSRWMLRRVNAAEQAPCMFYFHPWELDAGQPRQHGISAKTRFRHYVNLQRMPGRLRKLLNDFEWDRVDRVFLADL